MKIKKLFKKKAFKLSLIFLSLVGMLASGGNSFAKYIDNNYGNGNAGIAKFEFGMITYTPASIQMPKNADGLPEGVYAFACEFQLEIPVVEVSISYSIKLRLVARDVNDFNAEKSNLNKTSFSCSNTNIFYSFGPNDTNEDVIEKIESANLGEVVNESVTYTSGHWYKGFKDSNTATYTWSSTAYTDEIITFDSGTLAAGNSLTKYYKTIVFINAVKASNGSFTLESSQLLYSYDVEQVEVV